MRLENTEYRVKEMDGLKTITITKEALAEWRDHYLEVGDGHREEPFIWGLYVGKADVLTDLLKHFEEE